MITFPTIPSRHVSDPPLVPGYKLMESLGGTRYIAWRMAAPIQPVPVTARQSDGMPSPLEPDIVPLDISQKKASTLRMYQPLSHRLGIWWMEVPGGLDIDAWVQAGGGKIIGRDRIRMATHVEYRITIAQCGISPEVIASLDQVRWVYPVAKRPRPEDELSALEVVASPFRDMYQPGYTAMLTHRGLSGDSIAIGYIDTGFDTNSNTDCHPDVRGRIAAYITYPGSPNFDYTGHGTFVGGILVGDGLSGEVDTSGFLLGCGLVPRAVLVVSDALLAAPWPPAQGFGGMIRDIAEAGADMCNNAWWDGEGVGIGYTANCALWDAAVRDVYGGESAGSSYPMPVFFSAGNRGPDPYTLTSPKEAKNIITVSAAGSLRSGNPRALWSNSSRGPCLDGRFAPTLSAPGMEIYSCWPGNIHQALSGTSAAVPHVTGIAALAADFIRSYTGALPSPALLKAFLVNLSEPEGPLYPDPGWGWGIVSLHRSLPDFPKLSRLDQSVLLTYTGDVFETTIAVHPGETLRVTLAWTDAPAAPESNPALVNDLDLTILSRGISYFGNRFAGGFSVPGGEPDHLNNIEQIILSDPAPVCTLSVTASSLPGDGVPGNDTLTDQDFALMVSGGVLLMSDPDVCVNRKTMTVPDRVGLAVTDVTCAGNPWITVTAQSVHAGSAITLKLHEKVAGSGWFTGDLHTKPLDSSQVPDSLPAEKSDEIIVSYHNGMGRTVTTNIDVDAIPPHISDFHVKNIRSDETTMTWTTSERCRCNLHVREISANRFRSRRESSPVTDHEIRLSGLDSCTWHEMYMTCIDGAGNILDTYNGQPHIYWITDRRVCVYREMFDDAPQWPVMDGAWAWGVPDGAGNPPDPHSGYTGTHVLGYNLAGNYTNLLTPEIAEGPTLDCSIQGEYNLQFMRWLGTRKVIEDEALLDVCAADGMWVSVYRNPLVDWYDGKWTACSYDVTEWASGNPFFRFRFVQGPTDIAFTSCGWNIDDIILVRDEACLDPTPTPPAGWMVPTLYLHSDHYRYSPGSRLELTAVIQSPGNFDTVSMMVAVMIGDGFYFYPDWSSTPVALDLDISAGYQRFLLLDIMLPEDMAESFPLIFWGAVLDPETGEPLSPPSELPLFIGP